MASWSVIGRFACGVVIFLRAFSNHCDLAPVNGHAQNTAFGSTVRSALYACYTGACWFGPTTVGTSSRWKFLWAAAAAATIHN